MRRRLASLAHPPGALSSDIRPANLRPANVRPAKGEPAPFPPDLPPPEKAPVTVVECERAETAEPPSATPDDDTPSAFAISAVPRRILAFAAVAVLLVAAVVAWLSWPRPEAVAEPTEVLTSGPAPAAALLVVSVAGKVRRPGLVEVPPGSRVADAIAAAGGVADPADLGLLNLARKVVDGELIVVGTTGTGTGTGTSTGSQAAGPINLNAATITDLDTLPGVGPVLAQRIVDYRDANGGFASVDELRQVDGIGTARFDDLKDQVTV